MKIIYISGPISGLPEETAKARFAEAAEYLKTLGYTEIINPFDIPQPGSTEWHHYMRNDIKELCGCSHIYMLNCWQTSRGAKLEKLIAERLGMEVIYQLEIQ